MEGLKHRILNDKQHSFEVNLYNNAKLMIVSIGIKRIGYLIFELLYDDVYRVVEKYIIHLENYRKQEIGEAMELKVTGKNIMKILDVWTNHGKGLNVYNNWFHDILKEEDMKKLIE